MLAPHIIERENARTPGLPAFAMASSRVAGTNSTADNDRSAIARPIGECLCLFQAAGEWLVTHAERGEGYGMGRFAQCSDAIKFLYPYLVPGRSPYDYRAGRESPTGQQFSMLE
jgi:hypothetical protein